MGCCGGNRAKPSFSKIVTDTKSDNKIDVKVDNTPKNNPAMNMLVAAKSQHNVLAWFKDGVSGLAKCFTNEVKYTDSEIQSHRDVCRGCEHSTKTSGKITVSSQCMAPDPARNGAACGCFILCKTQVGTCPLEKWTDLTLNNKKLT